MKKKSIILIVSLVIVTIGATIFFGNQYAKAAQVRFYEDGYTLVSAAPTGADKQVKFLGGSNYRMTTGDKVTFKDIQGNAKEIERDSFVHFDDLAIGGLQKGLVFNLADMTSSSLSSFYSIQPGTVMTKSNAGYAVDNRGIPLELDNFMWKLSEDKYMLISDNIQLHFRDDDVREVQSFVEITYKDGVVLLQTEENLWQTISSECYATLEDETVVHFSERSIISDGEAVLSFNKMVINSDDNIEILPQDLNFQELKVPKFDIKSEDGKVGIAGEVGEVGELGITGISGETGNNGEQGDAGTVGGQGQGGQQGSQGSSGANGSSGSSGSAGSAGSTGGTGGTGGSGSEISIYPSFSVQDWKVSSTSLSCGITATDDDGMLEERNAIIQIFNNATGEKIYEESDAEEADTTGHDFSDLAPYLFEIENILEPDTQYRLVINAYYMPNEVLGTMRRDFLSKTFYTDSTGVFIEQVGSDERGLFVSLLKKDYSLATEATVYLFDNIADAEAFDLSSVGTRSEMTKGKDQTWIASVTTNLNNEESMGKDYRTVLDFSFDNISSGLIKELSPNTQYIARLRVKTGTTSLISDVMIKLTTLKTMASVEGTVVVKNRSSYSFDIQPTSVTDPNNGIINYRYDIYVADEYHANGKNANRVTFIESKKPTAISLQVDGKTIKQGVTYLAVLAATFYDNEKMVMLSAAPSNEFMMEGSSMPAVVFLIDSGNKPNTATPTSNFHDTITGTLVISGTSPILVDPSKQLTVNVEAPGYYYRQFTFSGETSGLSKGSDGTISIPFNLVGLRAQTQYRFSVYGWVNFNDGEGYTYVNIGSYVVSTPKTNSIEAKWASGATADSAVSARLYLTDASSSDSAAYEMSTSTRLVLNLYEGSGSGKVLKKTAIIADEQDDYYTSSIKENYYMASAAPILINESTFGLNNAQVPANTYTIEIGGIYDYTYDNSTYSEYEYNLSGYKNSIPVQNNSTIVSRQNAPPELVASGLGVSSMEITNDNASTYGGIYNAALPTKAVVGYLLTPHYDNGSKLGRTIRLYAFEANHFNHFNPDEYSEDVYLSNPIYNLINASRKDPVTASTELFASDEHLFLKGGTGNAPQMAFFFGDAPGEAKAKNVFNGVYYYYTGEYDATTKKGMSRGMQIQFAYVAGISTSADSTVNFIYPYQMGAYAGHTVNMPTSSVMDLPKQDPIVYAYPWSANGNYAVWKYWISDPDQAIPSNIKDIRGNDRAPWLIGETATKSGSNYTLNASGANIPGGVGNLATFVNENYTYRDHSGNEATMQFAPKGSNISKVVGDDFHFVVMEKGTNSIMDGMTQMGAEVQWYNPTIYNASNPIDPILSKKKISKTSNDGKVVYTLPTSVPIFRVHSQASNFAPINTDGVNVSLDLSSLKLNVFWINLTGLPAEAAKRNTGFRLVFSADGEKNVTIYKSLEGVHSAQGEANGSIMVRTSELSSLVGKRIKITVQMLFESGAAGYYTPNTSNAYALRTFHSDGSPGEFWSPDANDAILIERPSSDLMPAYNSMFYSALDSVGMGANVDYQAINRITNIGKFHQVNPSQANLYHKIGTTQPDKAFVSPITLTPITYKEDLPEIFLDNIVPTIKINMNTDIIVGLDFITFKDIILEGATKGNVGDNIFFKVYDLAAETNVINPITGNENWPMATADKTITFSGLKLNTGYRIIPYCTMVSNGTVVQLIDGTKTTAAGASYNISTRKEVSISHANIRYDASGYFAKRVTLSYDLDQMLGFNMTYELWPLNDLGEFVGEKPLLRTTDMGDHVYAPTGNEHVIVAGPTGEVQFRPGGFYAIKMVAISKSGELSEIGTQTVNFTIPAYRTPMFYLSALPSKTKDIYGISLNITVSDPDCSITTSENSTFKGDHLVYVYESGSMELIYQSVLLNTRTPDTLQISNLKENTTYMVKMYAISDVNGTGKDMEGNKLPLISELTEEELNSETQPPYLVQQSTLVSTLDSDGVQYGKVSIIGSGNQILLNFDGAVGIMDIIKEMTYSITYLAGDNVFTTTKIVVPVFNVVDGANGFYSITVPFTITEKQTRHDVTIQLKNGEGRVLQTISGKCYYS